ncbi:asparagine synthase-related protein, partial [Salmonella enterica]|uniref:asparagine synthase-related protein n=1 Tax=Salmonella enterica TaxID=28901 RepID=UPI0020A3F024
MRRYWDIDIRENRQVGEKEAAEQFSELLRRSIGRRLRSDVPLGTSLSGGLDSTTIASYICGDFLPESSLKT